MSPAARRGGLRAGLAAAHGWGAATPELRAAPASASLDDDTGSAVKVSRRERLASIIATFTEGLDQAVLVEARASLADG